MEKYVNTMEVRCDSIKFWQKSFSSIDQSYIFNQIGLTNSYLEKDVNNRDTINIGAKNLIYVDVVRNKKRWVVYYIEKYIPIIFIEIKKENPNSMIYLSKDDNYREIMCLLVENKDFILNKFKCFDTKTFIPPQ